MAPITNGDPILRRPEKNRLVVILSRSYRSEGGAESPLRGDSKTFASARINSPPDAPCRGLFSP